MVGAAGAPERIGRDGLIFADRCRIRRAPRPACARYWPHGGTRERCLRGTRTRARAARARLDGDAGGQGATVARDGRRRHRQDAAGAELAARARDEGFEVLVGRSIDLVGAELPYQPFVEALRPLGERRRARRPVRSCACSSRRWRCSATARRSPGAARPGGSALGRRLDARPRRLPRPQPRRPAGAAGRDLSRGRAGVGGTRAAGSPTACAVPARRSWSSSARSSRDELAALLAAAPTRLLPAALTDAIVARSEGNPFFAEELLAAGEAAASCRAVCATCCCGASRGSTVRRRSVLRVAAAAGRDVGYPLLARHGRAAGGRSARVAAQRRRARRPRRRPGDGQLPLPPRAAGGGDLRDDPARRARGAARPARRRARAQRTAATGGAGAPLGGRGSQRRGAGRVG